MRASTVMRLSTTSIFRHLSCFMWISVFSAACSIALPQLQGA